MVRSAPVERWTSNPFSVSLRMTALTWSSEAPRCITITINTSLSALSSKPVVRYAAGLSASFRVTGTGVAADGDPRRAPGLVDDPFEKTLYRARFERALRGTADP